jgi:hypothetical protein
MANTTKTPDRPQCQGRSLDEIRAALTGLGKDLHTGGRDRFGDVETLVRSARRDTSKLGKALRADVERLTKPTSLPAPPAPNARRRSAAKPRRPAGSHPKKTTA